MRILILGAGGPAGINFIKALRLIKNKYYIVGADCNYLHIAFLQPYVDKAYQTPLFGKTIVSKAEYVRTIDKIIKKEKIDVVYAQSDFEVFALSSIKSLLDVKICMPTFKDVLLGQDKQRTSQELGLNKAIQFSQNVTLEEIQECFDNIGPDIWIRASHGAGGRASFYPKTPENAYHWVKFWQTMSSPSDIKMIAQEYIPGENIAWQSIWYDGKLITSQARERLEYLYPNLNPSGITGTPVVQKTIRSDKVNEAGKRAVEQLFENKTGVFSVDMIKKENGECYITEVNTGRFFTTSYFFALAGQKYNIPDTNMPDLLMELAFNPENIDPNKYKQFDILPKDLYYFRHIDIPQQIFTKAELNKIIGSAKNV